MKKKTGATSSTKSAVRSAADSGGSRRAAARKAEPSVSDGSGIGAESTARWTFLTNHSHVLVLISRNPDVVLRQVALQVGITERAVQRIIADLEEAGILEREKVGRQNHYRIITDQPLRHSIESIGPSATSSHSCNLTPNEMSDDADAVQSERQEAGRLGTPLVVPPSGGKCAGRKPEPAEFGTTNHAGDCGPWQKKAVPW